MTPDELDQWRWEQAIEAVDALGLTAKDYGDPLVIAIRARLVREDVRPCVSQDNHKEVCVTSDGVSVNTKPETAEPVALACYDAGLLNDWGGGNVEWWQDYIRAELARAHDFYADQFTHPHQTEVVEALEKVAIPAHIAEQVLAMGRADWGATGEKTASEHMADFENTLRLTRENFNCEDVPVAMHGLYLEGTETVLCHTGTSPNSGANAQVLTGAWNWLYDQCATLKGSRP